MDTLNEYLSTKAEHLASSLYNYMLRSKRRRNNNNGYYYYYNNRYHGLETLIHSEENKLLPCTIVHCYNITKPSSTTTAENLIQYSSQLQLLSKSMWSSSSGSPAVRSTVMGDLIGAESGDCMSWDIFEKVAGESESESQSQRKYCRERKREKKEYPPAISLLRENGGMPLVFKKECDKDGRLILKREGVKYYDGYRVQAHRDNGRVIMTLVHHDHDEEEEEEVEESGFEFEKEMAEENCETGLGLGQCGDLRHCVSYAGTGFLKDLESFYLGRPGSVPLRPMTPVM